LVFTSLPLLIIDFPSYLYKKQAMITFLRDIAGHPRFTQLLISVIVLVLAIALARLVRHMMKKYLDTATQRLNVDATRYNFIRHVLSFAIILSALIIIFYTIPELKSLGLSLFAGAGILAVVIGLASQQAFSNIVSGVFIVIFKPFRVNDNIKVGSLFHGIVEDITLRHTVIRDFENRRIVIPNAVMSEETITNSTLTDEKMCNFLFIGISYDSDIDKAIRIIQEEARKHPHFLDNRSSEDLSLGVPDVVVRVISLGDFSVNLRAGIWTLNHRKGFELKCDLHKSIKERFDREGVEIPFPYRTLVYKKDLPAKASPEAGGDIPNQSL